MIESHPAQSQEIEKSPERVYTTKEILDYIYDLTPNYENPSSPRVRPTSGPYLESKTYQQDGITINEIYFTEQASIDGATKSWPLIRFREAKHDFYGQSNLEAPRYDGVQIYCVTPEGEKRYEDIEDITRPLIESGEEFLATLTNTLLPKSYQVDIETGNTPITENELKIRGETGQEKANRMAQSLIDIKALQNKMGKDIEEEKKVSRRGFIRLAAGATLGFGTFLFGYENGTLTERLKHANILDPEREKLLTSLGLADFIKLYNAYVNLQEFGPINNITISTKTIVPWIITLNQVLDGTIKSPDHESILEMKQGWMGLEITKEAIEKKLSGIKITGVRDTEPQIRSILREFASALPFSFMCLPDEVAIDTNKNRGGAFYDDGSLLTLDPYDPKNPENSKFILFHELTHAVNLKPNRKYTSLKEYLNYLTARITDAHKHISDSIVVSSPPRRADSGELFVSIHYYFESQLEKKSKKDKRVDQYLAALKGLLDENAQQIISEGNFNLNKEEKFNYLIISLLKKASFINEIPLAKRTPEEIRFLQTYQTYQVGELAIDMALHMLIDPPTSRTSGQWLTGGPQDQIWTSIEFGRYSNYAGLCSLSYPNSQVDTETASIRLGIQLSSDQLQQLPGVKKLEYLLAQTEASLTQEIQSGEEKIRIHKLKIEGGHYYLVSGSREGTSSILVSFAADTPFESFTFDQTTDPSEGNILLGQVFLMCTGVTSHGTQMYVPIGKDSPNWHLQLNQNSIRQYDFSNGIMLPAGDKYLKRMLSPYAPLEVKRTRVYPLEPTGEETVAVAAIPVTATSRVYPNWILSLYSVEGLKLQVLRVQDPQTLQKNQQVLLGGFFPHDFQTLTNPLEITTTAEGRKELHITLGGRKYKVIFPQIIDSMIQGTSFSTFQGGIQQHYNTVGGYGYFHFLVTNNPGLPSLPIENLELVHETSSTHSNPIRLY